MTTNRRTRSAEGWKSQSRLPPQAAVSSASSGVRCSGATRRSSTTDSGWRSESAAIASSYRVRVQRQLDRRGGLPDAMRIFDQREAHVAFAHGPESDARRDRNQRFFEQEFRELERAH